MGANSFLELARRADRADPDTEIPFPVMGRAEGYASAAEAFDDLVSESQSHDGSSYSGEIGMKAMPGFSVLGRVADFNEGITRAREMLLSGHPSIENKWGPAGCFEVETGPIGWVFFGFAAS